MTRMGNMIHEELSGAIIGIAMEVLNELRPGLASIGSALSASEIRPIPTFLTSNPSSPIRVIRG